MSSPRKDARWYLATLAVQNVGVDSPADLPYPIAEKLLSASDHLLDLVTEEKIQEFADKWNS